MPKISPLRAARTPNDDVSFLMNDSRIIDTTLGARTPKGEWTPHQPITYPPVIVWPPRPAAAFRWAVTIPGFLFPWNLLYVIFTALVYLFATPSATTASTFAVGWVSIILARNLALAVGWYSTFHGVLYRRRTQGTAFKFNDRWPRRSNRFLFGGQTRENVFWTLASGVPVWTAFEALTLWMHANGRLASVSWSNNPFWFVGLFFLIPLWREAHFFAVHRLIHVPALYKPIHALHHRNTNPGPWSGLSMHPVEHVLYFSGVLIHWIVASHPAHAIFTLIHLALAPAPGHCGFDRVVWSKDHSLPFGGQAHYLHHKYFEVNYADGVLPFDRWFGSFHDGTAEAHAALKSRIKSP